MLMRLSLYRIPYGLNERITFLKEASEYNDVEYKLADDTRDFDRGIISDLRENYNFQLLCFRTGLE